MSPHLRLPRKGGRKKEVTPVRGSSYDNPDVGVLSRLGNELHRSGHDEQRTGDTDEVLFSRLRQRQGQGFGNITGLHGVTAQPLQFGSQPLRGRRPRMGGAGHYDLIEYR